MWMPLSLMLFLMTFLYSSPFLTLLLFYVCGYYCRVSEKEEEQWEREECRSMLLSEYYKNTLFIAMEIKAYLPLLQHTYDDYVTSWCAFPFPFIAHTAFLRWEIFHFLITFIVFPSSSFTPLTHLLSLLLLHFHTTHNFFLFLFYFLLRIFFVNFMNGERERRKKEKNVFIRRRDAKRLLTDKH